jgi:hypothetical protein
MAHYAFLDKNNVVVQLIVGKDEGEDGIDWEVFYANEVGLPCKRTSYNTRRGVHYKSDGNTPTEDQSKAFRKNHGGIGFTYDAVRDAFIPPKPYPSWLLDEATCDWAAPVPKPIDSSRYRWDESTTSWVEVSNA